MVAEAEVVVGGEVDNALAVVSADGCLLVFEHTQIEEGPELLEIVELGGEVGELRTRGGCGGHDCYAKPKGCRQRGRRNEHPKQRRAVAVMPHWSK